MPGRVRVSGTFRKTSAIKVKVAGTWRNATQAYVKIAGEWKQWFSIGVSDTFSRTTTSNLGTSESSIAWASRFGTWTANGSVAVSSNAVLPGVAGALSYVNLASKDALTSVSTPNAGVGAAFWVTASGSWWAAHLTSDQTNTTFTYPCNCTCNGHNQTTCNTCTNAAFGTYSCPITYPATGSTSSVLQGAATAVTTGTDRGPASPNYSSQYQGPATAVPTSTYAGAATPVYSSQYQGAASVTSSTTYSHLGGSNAYRYCPGGESQYTCSGTFLSTQCYTYTYSCTGSLAGSYLSGTGCYSSPTLATYRGPATCSGTYYIASVGYNCDGLSCSGGQTGPHPGGTIGRSVNSCYCGNVTNSYSCAAFSGSTLSGTDCYTSTISSYTCPSGQTVSGSGCYTTSNVYNCNAFPGSTLSGTNCYTSVLTSYSCPAGQTVDGSRCYTYSTTYNCNAFPGSTLSGTNCYKDVTTYSCPSGGSLSGTTCTIPQTCNNSGTSCVYCGQTTTFIGGGTHPNCDSYGSTCQTCSGGSVTDNYYLQVIYSTASGAAYTVHSTSSLLASKPTSIQVSTGGDTATVTPYNGSTSLGSFTATNTGTKGNGSGIITAYAGTVNQATTVDNFNSIPLDL